MVKKNGLKKYFNEHTDVVPKTIRLPKDLWINLEKIAEKNLRSLNSVVMAALRKACDEEK